MRLAYTGAHRAAADDYSFPFAEQVPSTGLEFDLDFNLDPDLAQIALQYTQPTSNGFLEGEGGFLDTFLDQLNKDDAYGFPVEPMMPLGPQDYLNRPMMLGDQPDEAPPLGPVDTPMLRLPTGGNSNYVGSAEADWGDSVLGPAQRLPGPAVAASTALRTINQNEMQDQVSPAPAGPNVTTRASLHNVQQEPVAKRPRGRPRKIVANINMDEGPTTGGKRGLDEPEDSAAGPKKRAKTTKTAAGRKPAKRKVK